MVVAEAAASTAAEAAELGRVSVAAHVPVAQAALVGRLLARSAQAGLALTVIDLTVRDLMECTAAEASVRQVHVTAQCRGRGTEPIQG
jgi:regulator of RNase E activity RraA